MQSLLPQPFSVLLFFVSFSHVLSFRGTEFAVPRSGKLPSSFCPAPLGRIVSSRQNLSHRTQQQHAAGAECGLRDFFRKKISKDDVRQEWQQAAQSQRLPTEEHEDLSRGRPQAGAAPNVGSGVEPEAVQEARKRRAEQFGTPQPFQPPKNSMTDPLASSTRDPLSPLALGLGTSPQDQAERERRRQEQEADALRVLGKKAIDQRTREAAALIAAQEEEQRRKERSAALQVNFAVCQRVLCHAQY